MKQDMNKSLLIIGSPFQLLCAISAIREYKVSDYKIVLLRTDRLDQMENIATLYNLSMEIKIRRFIAVRRNFTIK